MNTAFGPNHWTTALESQSSASYTGNYPTYNAQQRESPSEEYMQSPRQSAGSEGGGSFSGSSGSSSRLESKLRSYRMSSPEVFQRVLKDLQTGLSLPEQSLHMHSPSPSTFAQPQIAINDQFEGFLMRQYVQSVAPMMNLYAMDSVFTHILPVLALSERVLYDSIMALSALSVHSKSPGTVSKETATHYMQSALRAIRENQDSAPYPRQLLYLCCSLLLILYNIVAADTGTVLQDLEIIYAKIKTLFVGRPQATSESGARDLFIVCVGLSFSIDLSISFRFNICCSWEPDFLEAVFKNEKLPILYTTEWWSQQGLLLLVRLSHFNHRSWVPTYEESRSDYRMAEWQSIYTDMLEYGRQLPQALKPVAQVPHKERAFPLIYVLDEYALLMNVSYHTGIIMALHIRPDQTPEQKLSVPAGAKEHAYQILGLLDTCDKPVFWITIYWAHRSASICLTDIEERSDALDLTRQYEWQTGYTFSMHLALIESRWNIIDAANNPQQQQQSR